MLDRLRRHPVLTVLTLLLLGAGSALTVFLYSFDLNDYRAQLQATLQSAIERPVRLGSIHFTVRNGLSLSVGEATIGTPEDDTLLKVEHLVLRLRFAPLLHRQLSFSSVVLDGAQLRIATGEREAKPQPPPEEGVPQRFNELLDRLRDTRITALSVRKGSVILIERKNGKKQETGIVDLDLQLRNLAVSGPIKIQATGQLLSSGVRSPWQLSGVIEPAGADAPWQETRSDLTLTVKGFKSEALRDLTGGTASPVQLHGSIDLTLRAEGTPLRGLAIELRAKGEKFSLAIPTLFQTPLTVNEALLSGTWQGDAQGDTIRNLLLRLDALTLSGDLQLPAPGMEGITVNLASAETPLALLGRFVPDLTLPSLARTLREPGVSGEVKIDAARLLWSPQGGLNLASARFLVKNGRFTRKETGPVTGVKLDLLWNENRLEIKEARATLLGGSSQGQGSISFAKPGEPSLNLQLDATATAAALAPLLPPLWQEKLHADGDLAFTAKIGGVPSRLLLDLTAHFNAAAISFNGIPLKRNGEAGELLILGAVDKTVLELSHSRLLLPFAEARANGRLALDASGGYSLACDIVNIAIDRLPLMLDVQKELAGRGLVDLRLDLSGDKDGLKTLAGSGEFRQLGLHLWDAVADIRGGSGRMLLTREGIEFPAVSALVGLSPVRAVASLKWLPSFSLTLDLDLSNTRAVDLVFNSPKKQFESIRGRLVITDSQLLFEKITARIADETTAVINGSLDYTPPRVALDIEASRANVAGLIALWSDGESRPHDEAEEHENPVTVEIAARIAEGNLYGISFSDAVGTIAVRNERLIVHPLTLKIGNGNATVQVVTSSFDDTHPLLKVSGRVDKVDAGLVQKEFLQRRGTVTGKLSSNFYLEGELGRYLETWNGGINLRLDKGLLRGFTSISRVLALFNVSKILTLRFPDVAKEGLLFDRISGNVTIRNGVMQTDDLALASPAFDMAFIGSDDLVKDKLDFIIGVKPLQTVDKVLSSIPVAGWILTGEKKALITAQFRVTGNAEDPKVEAVPISSLSDMAVGIFKRTFGLPGKMVDDVKELFK